MFVAEKFVVKEGKGHDANLAKLHGLYSIVVHLQRCSYACIVKSKPYGVLFSCMKVLILIQYLYSAYVFDNIEKNQTKHSPFDLFRCGTESRNFSKRMNSAESYLLVKYLIQLS